MVHYVYSWVVALSHTVLGKYCLWNELDREESGRGYKVGTYGCMEKQYQLLKEFVQEEKEYKNRTSMSME